MEEILQRTHRCGEITQKDLEKKIILQGWVSHRRDHGGVIFINLRDVSGIIQLVFDPAVNQEAHQVADKVRSEFVLQIEGILKKREKDQINPKMKTGELEIFVHQIKILNSSLTPPFPIQESNNPNEKIALQYRYLDLRREALQQNIITRSKVVHFIRNILAENNFIEVETPILTKSTPEGARDFIVPSRIQKGSFYALPQSPQLFKQLLMISGLDRYYQVSRCFRDEDLRNNRQPEFSQVDIELSFLNKKTLFALMEKIFQEVFKKILGIDLPTPFPILTYKEAMENYGCDAPDMRFAMQLKDITEIVGKSNFQVFSKAVEKGGIVKAIRIPQGADFSRGELDNLTQIAIQNKAKGMAWVKLTPQGWQSPISKFFTTEEQEKIVSQLQAKTGDLILFGADNSKIVHSVLSVLRNEIAKKMGLIPKKEFSFCWVVDFPLLDYSLEEKRMVSTHHPFTMPYLEDWEKYKEKDPLVIRSHSYDLVLNGVEIGGGSQRIHSSSLQKEILQKLGLEQEAEKDFHFLLNALKYGAPPHGGIALGLDRIMMFITEAESIRDVIAFPKTQNASCLLTEAPTPVSKKQLIDLSLRIKEKDI